MAKKTTNRKTRKPKGRSATSLPGKEKILQFISEHPELRTKRDLYKAFNIKGNQKVGFKALLREMRDDGLLEKKGKRVRKPGTLPPVSVIDIVTRDRDGGLLAKSLDWDERTEGKAPVIEVRGLSGGRRATAGVGDRALARLTPIGSSGRYTAKVIKVISKRDEEILGVIRLGANGNRLISAAKRSAEFEVHGSDLGEAKNGDLVTAEIVRGKKFGLKRARIRQIIGHSTDQNAASLIAIHTHEIPHQFPEVVIQEADAKKEVTADGREDWRDIPLITIDPADARDHDDAVHATKDESTGGYIVSVAIADVSAYVLPASPMDKEALLRGNSVYFPDRVVPMLPERISNDLCSLREGEDRPALAVRIRLDANGKKIKHSFHRVLMRSYAKLSYVQAQGAIDGNPDEKTKPILESILKPLWETYFIMQRARADRQPLELDLPERKIILDKAGNVESIRVPERLEAHKLVEEMMIQANVCAAETLERRKQPLIYRIHDAPSADKLEKLREFLSTIEISVAKAGQIRARHFNQILNTVKDTDHEALVNQVVLRSQSQAEYSPDNIGHFGLQLSRYAHFTSPIRRYADLIVHRSLVHSLSLGVGGITSNETKSLEEISAAVSLTERRAMAAERDTVDRLVAGYLSEQIGSVFPGRINGVTGAGLFVTLEDTGADGFVPIRSLGDEYFHFLEDEHAIVGESSGETFQMGQFVEVKLKEAQPISGGLLFEMQSEGKKQTRLKGQRSSPKRGRRGPQVRRGASHRKRRR